MQIRVSKEMEEPSETNVPNNAIHSNTSTETMKVNESSVDKTDGAKCDEQIAKNFTGGSGKILNSEVSLKENVEPVQSNRIERRGCISVKYKKCPVFGHHPEKISEKHCFSCDGEFGIFDTRYHISQIKSADRQKNILESK